MYLTDLHMLLMTNQANTVKVNPGKIKHLWSQTKNQRPRDVGSNVPRPYKGDVQGRMLVSVSFDPDVRWTFCLELPGMSDLDIR